MTKARNIVHSLSQEECHAIVQDELAILMHPSLAIRINSSDMEHGDGLVPGDTHVEIC